MLLIERIRTDLLAARKAREAVSTKLLTTLLSEAQRAGFDDGKRFSTDTEVMATIKKFIKNTNEVIDAQGGTAGNTQAQELDLLNGYMPSQLSDAELSAAITRIIAKIDGPSLKHMGAVMAELKNEHDGSFDGKAASAEVKAQLSA